MARILCLCALVCAVSSAAAKPRRRTALGATNIISQQRSANDDLAALDAATANVAQRLPPAAITAHKGASEAHPKKVSTPKHHHAKPESGAPSPLPKANAKASVLSKEHEELSDAGAAVESMLDAAELKAHEKHEAKLIRKESSVAPAKVVRVKAYAVHVDELHGPLSLIKDVERLREGAAAAAAERSSELEEQQDLASRHQERVKARKAAASRRVEAPTKKAADLRKVMQASEAAKDDALDSF